MKATLFILILLTGLNAFSYDRVITCEIDEHPVYSQAVLYGDSEIHFTTKDGRDSEDHHDGFILLENNDIITAYYHDGDDLLFYMSKNFNYGVVDVPGYSSDEASGLYSIYNCSIH
jgi:hypothetical protein